MKDEGSYMAKWYTKVLFLIVALTFGATIGYSRVFLGVHSWNQVLFGWQLGLWLALTLHFCFKQSIVRNLKQILYNDQSEEGSSLFSHTVKWLVLMVLVICIETVNYAV